MIYRKEKEIKITKKSDQKLKERLDYLNRVSSRPAQEFPTKKQIREVERQIKDTQNQTEERKKLSLSANKLNLSSISPSMRSVQIETRRKRLSKLLNDIGD